MRRLLLLPLLFCAGRAGAAPAAPQGELVTTVRVLVQNIYGRKKEDCEARYKALAANILAASPPYDVVALQEDWKISGDRWFTCDNSVLTKALEADGRYAGTGRSVRHKPSADALEASGGVSVFTRHKITDAYENKFVNGRPIPLSGYVLARVEVAPGVTLDVWDVHLEAGSDGCDDDCRWEQATDFGGAVELFAAKNPILIVGDFNTGGPMTKAEKPPYKGNGGYANVMDAMRDPRDLWLELGTGAGDTSDKERIDYVLLPEHPKVLSPDSAFVLAPRSVEVARWQTPAGKRVSDHFGLDATLEVRRRPKADAAALAEPSARVKDLLESPAY